MKSYQLYEIWAAVREVLSIPINMVEGILDNIAMEFYLVMRVLSGGGSLTPGMIWDV